LQNVNATFEWVRLAQRIPVRIKLVDVPNGTILSSGMTATVRIAPKHESEKEDHLVFSESRKGGRRIGETFVKATAREADATHLPFDSTIATPLFDGLGMSCARRNERLPPI